MSRTDPRVDAYIAKSADFAQPILTHLRKLVREAAPTLQETIKWGMPHFQGKGLVCGMAAFKQHCAFGFWNHRQVFDDGKAPAAKEAMGQFGCITRIADLPRKSAVVAYLRKAVALDEAGVKRAAPARARKAPMKVPVDLAAALKRNARARKAFAAFSSSQRREYVEWLTEARRAGTRAKRLATAIDWIADGKPRHWKYQKR